MAKRTQIEENVEKCVAGIVLYNPNLDRLKLNIESIKNQVKKVYCYDNHSKNTLEIRNFLKKYENVELIEGNENVGIGRALNVMASLVKRNEIEWFLALDQDSVCPNNFIDELLKYGKNSDIGILCPYIVDKRRPTLKKDDIELDNISYVEFCITSGSLFNLNVYNKIGGSDEHLFIGLVDDDYSYRVIKEGYKIIRINNVKLDHELGDLTPSRFSKFYIKLANMTKSYKILALSYHRNVSPMRVYYATRNILYLEKKYPGNSIYNFNRRFAIRNGISNILRSKNKMAVFRAFRKGYIDGSKS